MGARMHEARTVASDVTVAVDARVVLARNRRFAERALKALWADARVASAETG